MKQTRITLRQFLPAMALIGLMLGCGGDKDTEEQSGGGSSGAQGGGGDKEVTLAEFLPGKRLYVEVADRDYMTPKQFAKASEEDSTTFLLQFEKNGKCDVGAVLVDGKILRREADLTYKVSGPMKVTIFEDSKADGAVTFPTAHPKKGDKIKFGPDDEQMPGTIIKIGDASPMPRR